MACNHRIVTGEGNADPLWASLATWTTSW